MLFLFFASRLFLPLSSRNAATRMIVLLFNWESFKDNMKHTSSVLLLLTLPYFHLANLASFPIQ